MCKQTIVGRLWFGADTAQGALSKASNPKLEKFCVNQDVLSGQRGRLFKTYKTCELSGLACWEDDDDEDDLPEQLDGKQSKGNNRKQETWKKIFIE